MPAMFYVLSQLKSSEEEKGLCRREKSYAEHVFIYIDSLSPLNGWLHYILSRYIFIYNRSYV